MRIETFRALYMGSLWVSHTSACFVSAGYWIRGIGERVQGCTIRGRFCV